MSFSWIGKRNSAWIPVLFFLLLSFLYQIPGSLSRMMTLAAMTEYHTFKVDRYIAPVEWSFDWARTPDGHYYSNKAPGPMLLGYPFYRVIDFFLTPGKTSDIERNQARYDHFQRYVYLLSLFTQVIPFALLCLALADFLRRRGFTYWEIQFVAVAILFGNSVAFYMSSQYGHALAALLTFLTGMSLYYRRTAACGFFFGLSLLTDYGSAFMLLPLGVGLWILCRPRPAAFLHFVLGGILPGVLWIWYHTTCFGGPFSIPYKYQNPMFLDLAGETGNFWGVILPYPKPKVILQLLFGLHRGLIKTQPWVLLFVAWFFTHLTEVKKCDRALQALSIFSIGGLLGLIYMNACFGSWGGGSAPGPRYICAVMPLLALNLVLFFPRISRKWKKGFYFSLIPPVVYYAFYFAFRGDHFLGGIVVFNKGLQFGLLLAILGSMTWGLCYDKRRLGSAA